MKCRVAAVSANRAHVIRRYYSIRARVCKEGNEKFSESSHFCVERVAGQGLDVLQIWVCRGVMLMYFSLYVERKVPKERPSRESPTVPPLRNPPPDLRDSFAHGGAKESDRAESRQDPITRTAGRVPTARNSPLCCSPELLFFLSDKRNPWVAAKRAANRDGGAPPSLRLDGKLRLDSALAISP